MATKNTYKKATTIITLTAAEVEQILIERYANLPLVAVPEVEFLYDGDQLDSVSISYDVHEPVIHEVLGVTP